MKKVIAIMAASLLSLNGHAASQKILFGSCAHQDKPMPILGQVAKEQGDVFIFLGDNIYGDTEDMNLMAAKYQQLANNPDFKTLKQSTPLIAVWDDHDFGQNDAGAQYPMKEQSRKLMLDFWQEPKDSARYTQKDGIYTSYFYGDEANKVHIILPDLRFNRSPLAQVSAQDYKNKREPNNMGPYSPTTDPKASMLGENQWQWLELELQKPAKLKIIASSLQLLPEFTGWESWANYPNDRDRLLKLIKHYQVNGVMIISGDTHWGELSRFSKNLDYPLYEMTSSGITQEWKAISPNQHRVGAPTSELNYGQLEIDWQQADPTIEFLLKRQDGSQIIKQSLTLSSISPYKK